MANEFVVKNGLIVSGSTRVQGSVTATSFTGSFSGSIAFATSASYAVTASYALNAADSVWTGSAGNIYYNSGNVGIGTPSPVSLLDITSATAGYAYTSYQSYASATRWYVGAGNSGVTVQDFGIGINSNGNTPYLMIASGGSVGIGTISPGYKLDVNGTSAFRSDMYVIGTSTYWYNGSSYFQATNTSDVGILKMTNNSSPIALQPNGGSVGIGTTNPNEKLHVAGNIHAYAAGGIDAGLFASTSGGSTTIAIRSNGITHFNGGNVGIGTTNPIYKLQIAGSTYVNGGTLFLDSGQFLMWGNSAQGIRGVNDTSLDFYAGSTVRMVVTAGGNVGIGTTNPVQRLHVNGNIYMPSTNFITWNNGDSEIGGLSSGYGIRFSVYDGSATMVERMRIVSSGNVGIGVSTPAAKLQISGSTNVLNVRGSGSATTSSIFSVDGNNGRLFEVSDDLSNSLFSVNTIAGLPVIEAFADYSVTMGTYGQYVLQVTGSNVGIGSSAPQAKLDVNGNVRATSFTGSISGSATNAVSASYALTASYALNAGDSIWTGSAGNIYYNQGNVGIGTTNPTVKLDIVSSGGSGLRIIDSTAPNFYINNTTVQWKLYLPSGTNDFRINDAVGDYLTIKYNSGNVGIGTTNPSQKLVVIGNTAISGVTYTDFVQTYSGTSIDFRHQDASVVMRVDTANARVGIGTTGPETKLHVSGGPITLKGGGATDQQIIYNFAREYVNGIYNSSGHFRLQDNSLGGTVYQWDGSTFAFPNGNIGIGTTGPSGRVHIKSSGLNTYPLLIQRAANTNNIFYVVETSGGDGQVVIENSGGGAAVQLHSNGTSYFNGGNVGIGTTSPGAKLEVYNSGTAFANIKAGGGDYAYLQLTTPSSDNGYLIKNTATANSALNKSLYLWNGDGPIQFVPSGIIGNAVTINTSGNLGIGTTSPSAKLEVVNSARILGIFRAQSTPLTTFYDNTFAVGSDGGGANGFIYTSGTGGTFPLDYYGELILQASPRTGYNNGISLVTGTTTPTVKLRVAENGNVGIGINTPAGQLDVFTSVYQRFYVSYPSTYVTRLRIGANAFIDQDASNEVITIGQEYGGGDIAFNAGGNVERMRIIDTGNVGIGTTSPATALQVNGTARATRLNSTGGIVDFDAQTGNNFIQIASNIVSIANGGNVNMTITSAGNVGIGTTSPASPAGFAKMVELYSSTNVSYVLNANNTDKMDIGISSNGGYLGVSSNNALRFATNNTERIRITSDGNVGIGTTNPTGKLTIQSNSTQLRLETASDPSAYHTLIESNYNSANPLNIYSSAAASNAMGTIVLSGITGVNTYLNSYYGIVFGTSTSTITAGTVRMMIANDGNVGIATTSPTAKLEVIGNVKATSFTGSFSGSITHAVSASYALTASYALNAGDSIWTGSAGNIYYSGGNVGIGTASPGYKLDVTGDINVNSGVYRIGGNTILSGTTNVVVGSSGATGTVSLNTTSGAGLVLNGSSVGIGTASPTYKLHTYGTNPRVFIQDSSTGYPILQLGNNSSGNFYFAIDNSAGSGFGSAYGRFLYSEGAYPMVFVTNSAEAMRITSGGNIGIGTTNPAYRLDVNVASTSDALRIQQGSNSRFILNGDGVMLWGGGSANAGFLSWDTSLAIVGGQSGTALALYAAGSEKVRITTNGNVGIGNTNPLTKLFVAGTIRANGTDGQVDVDPTSGAFRFYDGSTFRGGFGTDAWATSGNASNLTTYLNGGNYYIYSTTTGTKIFTALADGNIGIGTTTPAAKLDIVGDAVIRNGYNMVIGDTIANPVASTSKAALTLRKFTSGNASTVVSASYYLGVGGNEYTIGSYRLIGFGYAETSGTTTYPAYIGYRETSTSGYTLGDLIFGTRATTGASDDPSERMRITSGGNVGIGITSPAYKLEVNGKIYSNTEIQANTAVMNTTGIYASFGSNSGSTPVRIGRDASLNDIIIDASGNVGIGSTSPGAKLDIVGTSSTFGISFGNTVPNNPLFINTYGGWSGIGMDQTTAGLRLVGDYSSGASPLVDIGYYSSATVGHATWVNRFRVLNNGNVGIGITNPARTLDINGTTNFRDATYFANGGVGYITWGTINSNNALNLQAASGYFLNFGTNATTGQMVIDTSGNVGIGTTSPGSKLDVDGGSATTVARLYNSSTTATQVEIGDSGNSQYSDLMFRSDSGQGEIWKSGTGYTSYGGASALNIYNSSGAIAFHPNNTSNAMFIATTSNVGIGTTSPAFKLDVNGNAAIGTKLSVGTTYNGFTANIAGTTYIIGASAWVNDGYGYANASSPTTGVFPTSGNDVDINTLGSTSLKVKAGGFVGIGTTNPLLPLDVVGTVRATTFIETSAKKYKTNIQNLEPQLNKVLQLQPVTFDWKEKKGERPSIGLIADDVINIYPEFVVKNKQDEIEGIDYSKLTAVLIQSVKELKEIIDRQQEQINALLTK